MQDGNQTIAVRHRTRGQRGAGGDRGARRDVLSRAPAGSTSPPSRPRSAGTTGSSSTPGPGRGGWSGATCSCRRPASTASPPAACSPTSTARPCRSASSRATPSTRAPAAATAPRGRRPSTRSPIPTASCIRCKRAGQRGEGKWERVGWDEALDDLAGAHPQGDRRAAPARDHVPRRPPGRGRLHRARARQLGRRRPQLPHQHLLRRRPAPATSSGCGIDRPSPDHANAEVILLVSAHLESGPLLQSARPAHHGGQAAGRQADRPRLAAVEHRHPCRRLGGAHPGLRSRDLPRHRQPPDPAAPLRPRVRAPLVELAASICEAEHPELPPTFDSFESRAGDALRELHLRVRRRRVRRRRGGARGGRRGGRAAPAPGSRPTPGAAPPRATSAAGRSRARCSCSTPCSARWPPRAAPIPTPGTSSSPSPSTCRRHPEHWNELTWPREFPLAIYELSFLLPHLPQGRPRQARRLLHPGLQPGVDQPRRLLAGSRR